jgi:transcription-repair coupling factor (superfamily II helicase)
MSLEGLRDLSVIATAPARRLAIKTFVAPYSVGLIREACLRELKRGGQIYFLHNDVASIESMREKLVGSRGWLWRDEPSLEGKPLYQAPSQSLEVV